MYEHALAQRAKALLRQGDWAGTGRHGNVKGQREEAMKVERGLLGRKGILGEDWTQEKWGCCMQPPQLQKHALEVRVAELPLHPENYRAYSCARWKELSRSGFGHPCSRY